MNIKGIIPPMITPFTEDGDVDYEAHRRNIGKWNKEELAGYLVLGSNSETALLTEEEKLKLIELTVSAAGKGKLLLAGTGLESTRETIRLTNRAAELGVQAALILTPNFYGGQMNNDALINHFRRVADGSRVPILIYNVPAYTHLVISVDAVAALSGHPNIIGMKDSSSDVPRLAALKGVLPDSFNLIVGSASALYPALALGVRAGILALANCAGNTCAEVQRLYDTGRQEEASDLYLRFVPVNVAVTATYGVPGLKYASILLGYEGGSVRAPLLPLSDAHKKEIKGILVTSGLLARG